MLDVHTKSKMNTTVGLVLAVVCSSVFVQQQETKGFGG